MAYLALGDSITWQPGYADLLGWEKLGIVGAQTLHWLPDGPIFANNEFPESADVVSIFLGANDAAARVDPAVYGERLDEIATHLDARYGDVLVITPVKREGFLNLGYTAAYRNEALALCDVRDDLDCVDVWPLLDLDLHFTSGGVHPNAEGHALIAEAVQQSLPEPGSWLLLTLVAAVACRWGRRRRSA